MTPLPPRPQVAELQQECERLRASAAQAAGAQTREREESAALAARVPALEAELEAKRKEVEQLGAMCAELMGAAEAKLAAK